MDFLNYMHIIDSRWSHWHYL